MDELNEKLTSLLNDPSAMEKLRGMAESFFREEKPQETKKPEALLPAEPDLSTISRLMGMMNKGSDDDRVKLLLALKPNLSPEKQGRVDGAVKIMKLIELLPLLKESGLFDL